MSVCVCGDLCNCSDGLEGHDADGVEGVLQPVDRLGQRHPIPAVGVGVRVRVSVSVSVSVRVSVRVTVRVGVGVGRGGGVAAGGSPPRPAPPCPRCTRKVDVRLPGKGDSNSHGARPVHLIITKLRWIRTRRCQ